MIDEFAQRVRERIRERGQHFAGQVTAGSATDYADYRSRTGRIEGLNDALEIVDETLKEMIHDDDD